MLNSGANKNILDSDNRTPMQLAHDCDREEIARLIDQYSVKRKGEDDLHQLSSLAQGKFVDSNKALVDAVKSDTSNISSLPGPNFWSHKTLKKAANTLPIPSKVDGQNCPNLPAH